MALTHNAAQAAAAEARIRATVARLEAEGRNPSLAAVVAAAGCSKTTAARTLRAMREERARPVPAAPEAVPERDAGAGTLRGRVRSLRRPGDVTPAKRTGRPTLLTPDVLKAVAASVEAGVPLEAAARVAGVSTRSLFAWLERGGKEPGSPFERFLHGVEKAEGVAIQRNVAIVQAAAEKSWQAGAWWLERRYPEWFGRRDSVSVAATGKVQVELRYVDDWHARDVIDVPMPQAPPERR